MSAAPSIGLALIVKDEEANLPRLLASIEAAFDQVVLVDTGSKDRTVAVFQEWANAEKERAIDATREGDVGRAFEWTVAEYGWHDDFAAARTFADSFLTTDWKVWADADDEIRGAENLRALAAQAPPELGAFVADYDYVQDEHGRCICRLRRERLVRAGAGRWDGRVHESQHVTGQLIGVGPDVVEWVHRKDLGSIDLARNVDLLEAWLGDEPDNPRVLQYLGTEYAARGRFDEGEALLRRYLDQPPGWLEERAQVLRKLALVLMQGNRYDEAIDAAFTAIRTLPTWPDSYLTLAECFYRAGEPGHAEHWARRVLEIGEPADSALILAPDDYSVQPRVVLAGALAAQGRLREAIAAAEQVLELKPGDERVTPGLTKWRRTLKVEDTVDLTAQLVELLIAHDEQLKARQVIDAAPHYCFDDPRLVGLRSLLRERLDHLYDPQGYAEHYETGGSKPEDFVPDEKVLELGDALPRCAFLLRSLEEAS